MIEVISIARIQREATAAAKRYTNINDACPYDFASDAGKAFKAAFIEERKQIEAAAGIQAYLKAAV